MRLVTSGDKYTKYVIKPNFNDGYTFSKYFAVEIEKTEIKMNKQVYLGPPILDISKMLMYELYCDCMQLKYESKLKPCYMYTDNFLYEMQTEDFYEDIAKDDDYIL